MSGRPEVGLRLRRWRHRLARAAQGVLRLDRTVYVDQRVQEYAAYWAEAARALGAEFAPLTDSVWEVRKNGRCTRLANYVTQCDDPVTLRLAGDKHYCLGLAMEAGIPVPRHVIVELEDLRPAYIFLKQQAGPCVVKPAKASSSGLGITTDVWDRGQLRDAAALASLYHRTLLVEQMALGESCRLLFLGGRLLHAVRRRGVRVMGDGASSIARLLAAQGRAELLRDRLAAHTLKAQGLGFASVPDPGILVLVRGVAAAPGATRELRTVYDESVTDVCAPELACELSGVVTALGSEFAGVDIVTTDLSVPLRNSGGKFLEINTTPGIHHHYVTPADRADPVATKVLAHLLGLTAASASTTRLSSDRGQQTHGDP